MSPNTRSALITGANSGLGFEAAAQLAEAGHPRIVLACRTIEKAETARTKLVERVGSDPFEVLAIDVGKADTVLAALAELTRRGGSIGFLLLNAGLVAGAHPTHSEGIEITMAASLVGHHTLTLGLLESGLLTANARIVIAGSEAARGDVPMMGITDVPTFADTHFEGDRVRAITAIAQAEAPYVYKNMPHYATVKLVVAWWAASLARRLPDGMTVNAVSPGAAPGTSAAQHQSAPMRFMMGTVMRWVGPFIGMAAPVSVAARRYLDAAEFGPEINGQFYCSAPGKMVGAMEAQSLAHVSDFATQEASWRALVALTGVDLPHASLRSVG